MIESILYIITCFLITVLICFHIYKAWRWSYWSRRGLETFEPNFMDISEQYFNSYFYFKRKGLKHGGTFLFFHPHYVAVDLNLIKNILISDFDHFVNRNLFEYTGEENYMHAHLFNLEDQLWKDLRNKLTPTFTSGKIKMMFKTLIETTYGLEDIFQQHSDSKTPLEMKDVMTRFTVDVIASVGLGIESNTLKNPHSEFTKFAKLLMDNFDAKTTVSYLYSSLPKWLIMSCHIVFKNLIKRYEFIQPPVEEFFKNIVTETVTYREKNNISRKDFLHLLLLLKNKDAPEDLKGPKETEGSLSKLSMNEIIAQCFVFFTAGYDTTSTALTFACYELARNPDVQEKLRKELHMVFSNNKQGLSYDVISEMSYLEQVVNETLRMYPAVKVLNRICKKDFQVAGTDFKLKKNEMVMIPIKAIHYDPDLYPEPDKFNPDRFSSENKSHMLLTQYIPFGEGPRMCIGSRFALLQIKVGLACIISKFRLSLNSKTELPLNIVKSFLTNGIKSGIWMNVDQI